MELGSLPPKLRGQAEEKIAAQRRENRKADERPGTRRKYGNEPCMAGGMRFDSRKEMRRYLELKAMSDAGEITGLRLQQHFTLAEAFRLPDGTAVRKIEYIADFTYFDGNGHYVIEDVKSEATRKNPAYSLKKRLMAGKGHVITEA